MAGSGHVVTDDLGRALAHEDAAGVQDQGDQPPRLADQQAQVLGGEGVGQSDRLFRRSDHHGHTMVFDGRLGNFAALQSG